jgi:hypothetical protein
LALSTGATACVADLSHTHQLQADKEKEWEANLQLVHADSTQYLLSLPVEERPDVIVHRPLAVFFRLFLSWPCRVVLTRPHRTHRTHRTQHALAQYIDPMYPHPKRRQKALTKIGMQLARALVGDDADANRLLEIAQQVLSPFSQRVCVCH